MYRVHNVTIRKEDQNKADDILMKHWMMGDIDAIKSNEDRDSDGTIKVIYWISPYICEDLEINTNEFIQAGIQVL